MQGCSMAPPSQFGRHCGEGNHAQGALEDLQVGMVPKLRQCRPFDEAESHYLRT